METDGLEHPHDSPCFQPLEPEAARNAARAADPRLLELIELATRLDHDAVDALIVVARGLAAAALKRR